MMLNDWRAESTRAAASRSSYRTVFCVDSSACRSASSDSSASRCSAPWRAESQGRVMATIALYAWRMSEGNVGMYQ